MRKLFILIGAITCLCALTILCGCTSQDTDATYDLTVTIATPEYQTCQQNAPAEMLLIDIDKAPADVLTCTWQQSTDGANFIDILTFSTSDDNLTSFSYTPLTDTPGVITYRAVITNGTQTVEAGPFTIEILAVE